MKRFKRILVGVDLCREDHLACEELDAHTLEAIEQAVWLATVNSASVQFLYSLDVSPSTQRLIEENTGSEPSVLDDARRILAGVAKRARDEEVTAEGQVVYGRAWVEIIRQVLRGKHDLVVVGAPLAGELRHFATGGVALKLLRKCPSPVWVTKPRSYSGLKSILVAHDLHAAGNLAMQLGCSMAELYDARLHVVHALEYPEHALVFRRRPTPDDMAKLENDARRQISRQLEGARLGHEPEIHVVESAPDEAILSQIHTARTDLLVMGTIARFTIPGVLMGSTAERLLPQIPCSVLAVKPPGFTSPITL